MFIESPRFPTDESFDHEGGPEFNVDVQILESGFEVRNPFWPQARRSYDAGYRAQSLDRVTAILEFFELCGGRESGFRYLDHRDFLSVRIGADLLDLPAISATDQVISIDTSTQDIFQLAKTVYSSGKKRRRVITKPVIGSVLVAIQGKVLPSALWDIDYVPTNLANEGHLTTGRVTLAANIQKTITGITQASSARVTTSAAHGLTTGYSVHFNSVAGMTQINGKRGIVTVVDSTHFDVDINSTGFSAYTSGGQINTQRQSSALAISVSGAFTHSSWTLITTTTPHNLVPGDIGVFSGGTDLNGRTATVMATPSANTFDVNINSIGLNVSSGGSFITAERVTAGFQFDVPVRFDIDKLPFSIKAWQAGGAEVPLIELRVI